MAADENVKIGLEPVLDKKATDKETKKIEKKLKKTGEKSGENFSKGFEKESKKGFDGVEKNIKRVAAAAAAFFSGRAAIGAAIRQEEAVNNLNASLARIGEFSNAASSDLQNFANKLQDTTRFGNEAILEQLSFAQGLGATADQSKRAVEAATDLAAALNVDLNSATRNVAKTLGGYAGELGEVIPELKNLTTEQLQSGAAIDLIAQKYKGLAEAQTRTFGGALEQTSNSFGDLLEDLGNLIIKSPEVIAVVNAFGQVFKNVGKFITNNSTNIKEFIGTSILTFISAIQTAIKAFRIFASAISESEGFKALGEQVSFVGNFIQKNFGTALRVASLSVNTFVNSFLAGFFRIKEAGVFVVSLLNEALKKVGLNTGFDSFLEESLAGATKDAEMFSEKASNSILSLFDPATYQESQQGFTEQFTSFLDNIKSQSIDEETGESVFASLFAPFSPENLQAVTDRISEFSDKAGKNLDRFGKKTKKVSNEASFELKNRLGTAIANGVDNIVGSILRGEDAFANFGKFLLTTFGDLAQQLGTFFIIQGIGVEALKAISGAAAVAAGVALVALGSIMKNIGGGSSGLQGGTAGPLGGGVAAPGVADTSTVVEETEEREAPEQRVQLVVQGDILDSQDTGRRLVSLLNENFKSEGSTIVEGNFV